MNGFTIYKEYYELITLLTEKEQQEILLAITKFMFEDIEPELNDKQTKIFNNLRRPLEKSKKRSKCGSITKSNENQEEIIEETNQNQNKIKTKSNENQNQNEKETHQDVNVNVIVNDNVNVNKISLEEIKGIVDYLNLKSNSHYKFSSSKTQSLIKARINDGFTLEDFKVVIDNKCEEWLGTDFEKFLRPETLFSNKFEGYLNQKPVSKTKTKSDEQWEILKGVYDGTIKVN
ncbi:MAG: conserved phage C-terminal domain-containing protein [Clostridia bacterium]|nr:conserved phage C-terminal domain-containing protein [Clostridia bacterium]